MKKTFNERVTILSAYIKENHLESLVLGISGGIDSTLCAAICMEACIATKIKFIGRSLPMSTNKDDEVALSRLVGITFCPDDFKIVQLADIQHYTCTAISEGMELPNLQKGNIQARLRMIYLYNLASLNKGMVIDTDNLTEHYLGFWTIHGDDGDYNPIADLWKTEVYEMAEYVKEKYKAKDDILSEVIEKSINATPTDGLGISNSDLDQIGASSYKHVDKILQSLLNTHSSFADVMYDLQFNEGIDANEIANVYNKYYKSRFKRRSRPINPY